MVSSLAPGHIPRYFWCRVVRLARSRRFPKLLRRKPHRGIAGEFFRQRGDFNGENAWQFAADGGWQARQFVSFNAVFSLKGTDGKPMPLFNFNNGNVDPAVALYWEQHYDISRILRDEWTTIEPKLRRKIHIFVGDRDNFHLDDSVALMKKGIAWSRKRCRDRSIVGLRSLDYLQRTPRPAALYC